MQHHQVKYNLTALFAAGLMGLLPLQTQEKAPSLAAPAHVTVTVQPLGENKRMPDINREDVVVRQGKDRLQVTEWTPAREDHAGLDLFFLVDDACDPSLGSQLNDWRAFINAQPPTTAVGVGYMRNTTVQIVQNFTKEHEQAAKALRLPTFGYRFVYPKAQAAEIATTCNEPVPETPDATAKRCRSHSRSTSRAGENLGLRRHSGQAGGKI